MPKGGESRAWAYAVPPARLSLVANRLRDFSETAG